MRDGVASKEVPAVLLHGFTGSKRTWGSTVLDGLAEAGIQAYPIDLPGHGARRHEVAPSEHELEAVMASIGEAVDGVGRGQAPDATPPALVGYSMGGRLALHFAVRHPHRVSALVLESASPGLARDAERVRRRMDDEALAQALESEGIERFVEHWASLPLFASRRRLPQTVRNSLRAAQLANEPRALAASLRGLGTGGLPSLWDRLPETPVPTLVVVGSLDDKFMEIGRRMVDLLPHARLAVIRNCGHTVHLEDPSAWTEVVGGFLARHALERRGPQG